MRRADLPLLILAAVLLSSALPCAGGARAQNHGQVEQYVSRTGEIVAWAADLVRESDSQRARRVLDEAGRLHDRSLQLLADARPALAYGTSRRARQGAQQAARFARAAQGQEERARVRLERYRDLRDQIGDRAREAGDERALRFVHESEQQALRAGDHYRQGNFEMALQLIEPAEAMLTRAARLLFEGGGGERLEREWERTREFIERTAERLAAADGAAADTGDDLLRTARDALARAREAADRGQPLAALQSLRLARRLAGQAASTVADDLQPEAVAEQLERFDARAEAVAERVQDAGSHQAEQLLERARHHRDRAGQLLDSGELEQSLRQLRAAFDLLNEANDLTR